MLKAVLFDLDGVIANSEPIKALTHSKIVQSLGKKLDEDLYSKVLGHSAQYVYEKIKEATKIESKFEEYQKKYNDFYYKILQNDCTLTPGFYNFFLELKKNNLRIGLITSSPKEAVLKIIALKDIFHRFDCIVSEESVKEHKPLPAPYLKGLNILNVYASEVLAFEDTTAGIKSAKAAGLSVIGIRHPLTIHQNFDGVIDCWNNFEEKNYKQLLQNYLDSTT